MKLDRKKPFGIISGEHGAVYEQDGRVFGSDDNEIVTEEKVIVSTTEEKPKAKGKVAAAKVETKAAADVVKPAVPADPIDAQLAAQGA